MTTPAEGKAPRGRRLGWLIRLAVAVLLLVTLVQAEDARSGIEAALARAGWPALAAGTAWQLFPLLLCAVAWRQMEPLPAFRFPLLLLGRWIRDSVDTLVSFVPMSGEWAATRVLGRYGIAAVPAIASMVADLTCELLAQVVFALAGVVLWLIRHPSEQVLRWSVIGILVGVPAILGFFFAQRAGLFHLLDRLSDRLLPQAWRGAAIGAGVHLRLAQLYADRARVLRCLAVHFAAWAASAGEAVIGLSFLGHPLPLIDVLAMESAIFAIRNASFAMPAGLGIQEGGYVLMGAALGLPPEIALSVSLLKRGRELILGLPSVVVWQHAEFLGRRGSPVP